MTTSNITFTKTRNVKSPNRAFDGIEAGTDFFVPEYSPEFYEDIMSKNEKGHFDLTVSPNIDNMTITINPGGRINIPSGIKVFFEDSNTCLLAVNKSGIAAKKGLVCGACLIDASYRGEIHLNVINTGTTPVSIKTGDKLVQFMHLPVFYPAWHEVSNEEYTNTATATSRGEGGFGSSGTT